MFFAFTNLMDPGGGRDQLLSSQTQDADSGRVTEKHNGVAPAYAGISGLGSSLVCGVDPEAESLLDDEDKSYLDPDGVQRRGRRIVTG